MFREIIKALKAKDVLHDLINQIGRMLEIGKWMFQTASDSLMRTSEWSKVSEELYAKDKKVNEIEQAVRERIVTHLSLGHKEDLSPCLVLMSVVKDAERIGDYCKNIFEIGKFYKNEYSHPEYAETLRSIRQDVEPLFDNARKAFLEADRDLAYETLDTASKLRGRCDVVIRQLLTIHDKIAPDEAVAYVLLARFYKRVAAHLANIATSVVSPVPMLDYRGKNLPEEEV